MVSAYGYLVEVRPSMDAPRSDSKIFGVPHHFALHFGSIDRILKERSIDP